MIIMEYTEVSKRVMPFTLEQKILPTQEHVSYIKMKLIHNELHPHFST